MKNIILLHGWGANTKKLQPLAQSLRIKKWKVLIPELPGFDAPEPDTDWPLDEYAEYVSNFAKKTFADKKYFVFGHSFGGGIAIKLAASDASLSGVILCASRGISRGNPIKRGVFLVLAKAGKILLVILPLANLWRRLLYKLAREHDYEKASPRMKDIFKKIVEEDLKAVVPKIKVPALVLWGKKDKMTPVQDAYFLKTNLKNSKLLVYKNFGHRLPYEAPSALAVEIDKWTKQLYSY